MSETSWLPSKRAALGVAKVAGQDAQIHLCACDRADNRFAEPVAGIEVRIADLQDAIAIERARQAREAEFHRVVADVETIREAALPHAAQLESQPQRRLREFQRRIAPRPVRRHAQHAPLFGTAGLERHGVVVMLEGGRRQFQRAQGEFRQCKSPAL
jgi:hypothetical protein